MSLRAYRTFQALILGGMGVYLLSKVVDGRILMYINQRFVLLVLAAALLLIFLAQLVLRERPAPAVEDGEPGGPHDDDHGDDHDHHHDHAHAEHGPTERKGWVLWLAALPLLIGVLAPQRPLSASALENRGVNTGASLSVRGAAQALEIPPEQRTVLDWLRVFNESSDLNELKGQPADVTGFVYHDTRLEPGQFMVGRFTIACCVADAAAISVVVEWPDAASLPGNSWVRVQGPVDVYELDGKKLPLVQARQVEAIPEPAQPYLFP